MLVCVQKNIGGSEEKKTSPNFLLFLLYVTTSLVGDKNVGWVLGLFFEQIMGYANRF